MRFFDFEVNFSIHRVFSTHLLYYYSTFFTGFFLRIFQNFFQLRQILRFHSRITPLMYGVLNGRRVSESIRRSVEQAAGVNINYIMNGK